MVSTGESQAKWFALTIPRSCSACIWSTAGGHFGRLTQGRTVIGWVMSTFRRRTFASSIRENTWIHAWWQLRTISRTSSTSFRSTKDTIQRLGIVFVGAMVTIPLLLVTFYSWGLRFAGFWRGLGKLCVVVIADWDMERTELISKGSNCIGSICGIHVRTSDAYTLKRKILSHELTLWYSIQKLSYLLLDWLSRNLC